MVMAVDFDFIHRLEGRRVLKGYVPDPKLSDSRLTIVSGVDLEQRDKRSLRRLGGCVGKFAEFQRRLSDVLKHRRRPARYSDRRVIRGLASQYFEY